MEGRSTNLSVGSLEVVSPTVVGAGIAVGEAPVLAYEELATDEWVRANGFWAEVSHPQFGRFTPFVNPPHGRGHARLWERAPDLGEHTAEVMGWQPDEVSKASAARAAVKPRAADQYRRTRDAFGGDRLRGSDQERRRWPLQSSNVQLEA